MQLTVLFPPLTHGTYVYMYVHAYDTLTHVRTYNKHALCMLHSCRRI